MSKKGSLTIFGCHYIGIIFSLPNLDKPLLIKQVGERKQCICANQNPPFCAVSSGLSMPFLVTKSHHFYFFTMITLVNKPF